MPSHIGLDTSFLIGLLDEKDLWHEPALAVQAALQTSNAQLHVFDCVLTEVISTLARRTHEKCRTAELKTLIARLKSQFPTKAITWLYPDLPSQYDEVVNLVEATKGELNFNDALIAIACCQRGIGLLVSFDADFDQVDGLTRIASPSDLLA